jgi:cytochrome b561
MKFQQKFTLFHRLLHWIMAIAMPILFITGFLRMYWMNKNNIVAVIESKTSAIPKEQMTDIAKAIREPMWQCNIPLQVFVLKKKQLSGFPFLFLRKRN